jgi:hypothetical protein
MEIVMWNDERGEVGGKEVRTKRKVEKEIDIDIGIDTALMMGWRGKEISKRIY